MFSHLNLRKNIDHSCFNFRPNSGDCSSATTGDMPYSDPLVLSATSSEVYPWSTIQDLAKEQPASRDVPPRETSVSWMPSSRQPVSYLHVAGFCKKKQYMRIRKMTKIRIFALRKFLCFPFDFI